MPIREEMADALIQMVLGDLRGNTYEVVIPTAREFVTAAKHILWVVEGDRTLGEEPGSFIASLIDTMMRADEFHRGRLARVYPHYAAHVHMYKTNPDGPRSMRAIATLLD